jgi:hypothetical protein
MAAWRPSIYNRSNHRMKIDILKFEDHELKFIDATIEYAHQVADNKPVVIDHLNLLLFPLHVTTATPSVTLEVACGTSLVYGVGVHVKQPSDFKVTFNPSGYADPSPPQPIHARDMMCSHAFIEHDLGAFDARAPLSATFEADPETSIEMVLVCTLVAPWHATIDLGWAPDQLVRFMKLGTIENLNERGLEELKQLLRSLTHRLDTAGQLPA